MDQMKTFEQKNVDCYLDVVPHVEVLDVPVVHMFPVVLQIVTQ